MIHVTEAIKLCGLSDMEFVGEFALERGAAVHAAIALDAVGELDEASVDPVHVAPRLASFRAWRAQANPKIVCVESTVRNEAMAYVGRLDQIVELPALGITVIDVKNGAAANWHPYQTALYALAWVSERGGATPHRGCLYLDPNGKPAKFVQHHDRRDFERAKAIVTVAYIVKESA